MNCYKCDGTYQQRSDSLELHDPYVGPISIHGVPYYKCDKCGEILYTVEMSQSLETARNKRMQELLSQLPIGDFLSAAETALMLGISRQALHKNHRIRHGFIYQTTFGGSTVFLKQSVVHFKKTGDGRFPLYWRSYSPSIQYGVKYRSVSKHLTSVSYAQPTTRQPAHTLFEKKYTISKESAYAN